MEAPPIRYAYTPAGAVAWQECGVPDGPPLVFIPPLAQHIELKWERPVFWRPILRLASRVRFIHYDKLGTGLSDPVDAPEDLTGRVAQLVAVLDRAGVGRAAVMGLSEGGTTAIAMAAWHPERVSALILAATSPGDSARPGAAAYGPVDTAEQARLFWEQFVAKWGRADTLSLSHLAPSLRGDPAMRAWVPRYERAAASPLLIRRWLHCARGLDVVDLLPRVRTPTLIMHLRGDRVVPVAYGRYLAGQIHDARYVESDGDDHFLWMSPDVDGYIDVIHGFLAEHGLAATVPARAGRVRDVWDPLDPLTPGERRCVRLAQRGMANGAIAAALGLSVRTVENHLSRSFDKLGVRSRVELALLVEPGMATPVEPASS